MSAPDHLRGPTGHPHGRVGRLALPPVRAVKGWADGPVPGYGGGVLVGVVSRSGPFGELVAALTRTRGWATVVRPPSDAGVATTGDAVVIEVSGGDLPSLELIARLTDEGAPVVTVAADERAAHELHRMGLVCTLMAPFAATDLLEALEGAVRGGPFDGPTARLRRTRLAGGTRWCERLRAAAG